MGNIYLKLLEEIEGTHEQNEYRRNSRTDFMLSTTYIQ
jgi:hypothetical protein